MALRDDGVSFRGGTVRIENWRRLTEVGDFDAGYLQTDLQSSARLRIVPSNAA
jgi:hypothetical protein